MKSWGILICLLLTVSSSRLSLGETSESNTLSLSVGATNEHPTPSTDQSPIDAALIARGKYIADAGDCAGCHTAPQGGKPFAGGLGLTSPFGTIISSNITPDPRYGIGSYSYEDFERALRRGIAPGGKRLYPAMPYPSFVKMSDADVEALYAYMMHGVPPVARPAPPTNIPFPFNQRWVLSFWQAAFMPHDRYQAHPERDAQWNRGAYLVQSLGHCGSCHTPRGIGFQEKGYDESSGAFLAGGVNDNWFAANLTGEPTAGLGRVEEAQLASFLKTGHGDGLVAFGSMVAQVEDSTQYLTDDDLRAVAHYLKTLESQRPSGHLTSLGVPTTAGVGAERIAEDQAFGARIYASFCVMCHQIDGKGVPQRFPRLAGNPIVLGEDTTSLIRLMVEGGGSPQTRTSPARQEMPAFAGKLNDLQIAQVLSYVRTSWGNDSPQVTANDVQQLRSALHK